VQVSADRDRCMASGQCALLAPGIFGTREDGTVLLRRAEASDAERDDVQDAVDACPAAALSVAG
jgi:ferredoxin